uniref:Uncharacterized protein n=1 Tax=Myotis myotis TaxID=51298 RepID=A0A7J7S227_MYOMY|nr:hypothetical protein mMyoMyo1_010097 [Myotis myotis]
MVLGTDARAQAGVLWPLLAGWGSGRAQHLVPSFRGSDVDLAPRGDVTAPGLTLTPICLRHTEADVLSGMKLNLKTRTEQQESAWRDGAGPRSPAVPEDAGLGPATTVSCADCGPHTPCCRWMVRLPPNLRVSDEDSLKSCPELCILD